MRLTIVAATGGIGQHLLRQAIEAGHDVTAIARSPEKITDPVRTAQADLARARYAGLARMEDAVRARGPDWTSAARRSSPTAR